MPSKQRAPRPLFALRAPVPPRLGWGLTLASVVTLLVAWCIVSYVMVQRSGESQPLVPHTFLPAPHQVLKALLFLVFELKLLEAVGVSALRIMVAIGLSLLVAFPLGVAMASFDVINRVLDPIVAPLRYLPITAFIPLLILWFGIDESQKIAFLFLGTVVFLLPAVIDALRAVPDELVQTAYTLGASKGQVIWSVLIPSALPQIFDGFRTMNAIAWTYIILAEIVNARSGIGYLLNEAYKRNKPDWSFAGILVVGVIGLLTDVAIRGLNRLLFSWRETDA